MSTAAPTSLFPVPGINDLPDDIDRAIPAMREKAGLMPDVYTSLPEIA